jgi:Zn ribbon nucleic-acid-binding protein
MKHRWDDINNPNYQVIVNPKGFGLVCPKCGAPMEHTLVDDGEEVVIHYYCSFCGHSMTMVRKPD